ncbi:MAG: hypothetical protein B6241_01250 [Spirochaetaceae bacterium 4572_59]|nr:MAG: hypothetical protein B6241_01250 [Spirochaetaceae bacterium 4572_59]
MKKIHILLIGFFLVSIGFITYGCQKSQSVLKLENVSFPSSTDSTIILTIEADDLVKTYSLAQIEQLGMKKMGTNTYWPEDDGIYEGVLLSSLLKDVNLQEIDSLKIVALDDYTCEIPREHWKNWPVLVATRRNGKVLTVKEKGPMRIIYPKFLGEELDDEYRTIYWIWNIKAMKGKTGN